MPNRLQHESSPYLLQHANNPVDWYPWSPEAWDRAQREEKPVFLSIGYAACHWCHVMEHESFESSAIASLLNKNFICIKVDREERPDLDHIYMQAVQMLTGRGGWPMSVFLTPTREPFFGGTYWPPEPRHGMPGFADVLQAVLDAWQHRRDQAVQQAQELTARIKSDVTGAEGSVDLQLLEDAATRICQQCDPVHGGFGQAPKFPHAMVLQFLLRLWSRDRERHGDLLQVVTKNLDKMAGGGIYDHLAGGFARYSVDAQWLVPHFEKMLYDNALLADTYLDAYRITGAAPYGRVAREICDYVLGYMTDEEGAFHSSEDADSEGEEGTFYVWSLAEIQQVLGRELSERFAYVHGVSERGNFEGKNILHRPKTLEQCASLQGWNLAELTEEMVAARERLRAVRDQRVRPGKDDKVLVSWNGLMIHSLARAGTVLEEPRFLAAAIRAAEFLWTRVRRDDGRVLHTYRRGTAKLDAFLDDYTNLAHACTTLYEATFDVRWIERAVRLADVLMTRFADHQGSGFFYTADDHEPLIARIKDLQDNSLPSGNAMAATVLVRLRALCHRNDFWDAAQGALQLALPLIREYPIAVGQMLIAADFSVGPLRQVVIAEPREEAAQRLRRRFLPRTVIAAPSATPHLSRLVGDKGAAEGESRLYLCEDFACQLPVTGAQAVLSVIEKLSPGSEPLPS